MIARSVALTLGLVGLTAVVGYPLARPDAPADARARSLGPLDLHYASFIDVGDDNGSAPVAPQDLEGPAYNGNYHFVRIAFQSGRGGFGGFGRRRGGAMWAHDYPRADRNFLAILSETTYIDTSRAESNVYTLLDEELYRHPVSYIVEPGFWNPTDEEVAQLGDYLLKGGFLMVDDFRGPRELDNLEFHLKRALPDHNMLEVTDADEIFDSFFRIVPQDVVPPYGGYPPSWYGIYEDNDPTKRLMVIINANNDMAEYWEFSDYGYYPIDLANEAYKLGVNYVVYAMTH